MDAGVHVGDRVVSQIGGGDGEGESEFNAVRSRDILVDPLGDSDRCRESAKIFSIDSVHVDVGGQIFDREGLPLEVDFVEVVARKLGVPFFKFEVCNRKLSGRLSESLEGSVISVGVETNAEFDIKVSEEACLFIKSRRVGSKLIDGD